MAQATYNFRQIRQHLRNNRRLLARQNDAETETPELVTVLAYDLTSGSPDLQEFLIEGLQLEEKGTAVIIGGRRIPLGTFLAIILSTALVIALVILAVILVRRRPQFPSNGHPPPPVTRESSDNIPKVSRVQWLKNLSTSALSARADSTTLGNYKEIGSRSAPELKIGAPNRADESWGGREGEDSERGLAFNGSVSSFNGSWNARSKTRNRDSGWEAQIPEYRPSTAPNYSAPGTKNAYLSLIREPSFLPPTPTFPLRIASSSTESPAYPPLRIGKMGTKTAFEHNLDNLRYSGTLLPLSVAKVRLGGKDQDDLIIRKAKVLPNPEQAAVPSSSMQTSRSPSPPDSTSSYPYNDPRRPSEDSGTPNSPGSTPPVLFPLRAPPPKNPARRIAAGPPLSPPPSSPLPEPPLSPLLPLPKPAQGRFTPSPPPTYKGCTISPSEHVLPASVNVPAKVSNTQPSSPNLKPRKLARKKSLRRLDGKDRAKEAERPAGEYSQWDESSDEERFGLDRIKRRVTVKRAKRDN